MIKGRLDTTEENISKLETTARGTSKNEVK